MLERAKILKRYIRLLTINFFQIVFINITTIIYLNKNSLFSIGVQQGQWTFHRRKEVIGFSSKNNETDL